jgi:transposase
MIEADKRMAIFLLHQEGLSLKQIVRQLKVSRNTVRAVIKQQGKAPLSSRRDKIIINPELLGRLYAECGGWIRRVCEKLNEEEHLQVKYSTVTRRVRSMGLGKPSEQRCDRVPDKPGAEFQHDTSKYAIRLSGIVTWLIASLMYLRYSKRRYLKFYRTFNRFMMKCFLHEGLMHWGYAAPECIIDNTNLARLRGTGKNAVMAPEMIAFGEQRRFKFVCHEKGHANRKAGEERSFWTVESNFFPGRTFESLEDLNRQAFEWATVRMYNRPTDTGLIPAKAFEYERAYLLELSRHLPAPYLIHERGTDQYGYAAFDGNYFWVPGTDRNDVKLFEYSDRLKICLNRQCIAEYPLPADGVKNQRFSPEGMPAPRFQPYNRKRPTAEEEKRLRAMSPVVGQYLDFVLNGEGGIQRHRFIRELYALTGRMPDTVFIRALERALRYQITSIETIQRIALLYVTQGTPGIPSVVVDEAFRERESYLEGSLTDAPDLSVYDRLLEDDDDE